MKTREAPDFRNADLQNINLGRLGQANTLGADLTNAILDGANLSGGLFRGADFTSASLHDTILIKADLRETYFHNANMTAVDLTESDIRGADFTKANLKKANLTNAKMQYTGLDFVNLSTVIGLDSCKHFGPSDIGFRTLTESGNLPNSFLRGCGLSDILIENLPFLTNDAIQFDSCFISYSHKDKEVADKLFEELQMKSIRCWKDDHSIRLGENIRDAIYYGIQMREKVILICSAASLESKWVKDEIDKAIEKEFNIPNEPGKTAIVLIPLIIDNHLSQWVDGRASLLRTRLCGDFCKWKIPAEFDKAFNILINSLRKFSR